MPKASAFKNHNQKPYSNFPTTMTTLFTNLLTAVCVAGCIVCSATVFFYTTREFWRELFDTFNAASRLTKLVVFLTVGGATWFAGAKHGSTNEPPDQTSQTNQTSQTSSPTNDPPPMMMAMLPPSLTTNNQQLTTIPQWTARGAWMDWREVTFPAGFSFPLGTNLLTSVTLMSYGELRPSLHGPVIASFNQLPTTNQPTTLSIEPDASSVSYGLTPSNSLIFVWSNACVNRDPTNRINAAIELFPSGTIAITAQFGDETPTTNYQLPTTPPGFVGVGQDEDWATNSFPSAAAAIAEKGYDTWLEEDYVGVNVENGHYQLKVTVGSIPDNMPCYLVCGPHKIVVPHPGTYSFPLEVFETYKIRTYPVALPLTFSSDDGYRDDDEPPMLCMSAPQMTSAPPSVSPEYEHSEQPRCVGSPIRVALSQAVGTIITIWCNVANGFQTRFSSLTGGTQLRFIAPSQAEIVDARVADLVTIFKELDDKCRGITVDIYDDTIHEHHDDLTCCCGSTHCPNCTCYGCLYEGVCSCGHVLTDEELSHLWGDEEP